ncbi:hypothetical protein [Marinomonas epiphytica]
MNTFTKSAMAAFTAVLMTSTAMASDDDSQRERVRTAQAGVEALAKTLSLKGAQVDAQVDVSKISGFYQKEQAYRLKHKELQAQFDALNS